jgi:type I restriction enzyme S subunit
MMSYSNTEFKNTPISEIPKEWELVKLEEIIFPPQTGIWGDEPNEEKSNYPVIRSTEITYDGKIDLTTVAYRSIPEDKIEKYCLLDGDILLVGSSGSSHLIGRAALFRKPSDKQVYFFSNFMIRIRPKNVSSSFLYYFLSSQQYYRFLKSFQQTSTGLRNFPKNQFININIFLPPLPEQQKIAEILGTVDEAIEKVDKAIEKTERLKKGLMQEFLTKGIGHKEFKNSEIGKIPKEWRVVKLSDIFKLSSGRARPEGLSEINSEKMPYPIYGGNGILGYTDKFITDNETIIIGRVGEYCGSIHKAPRFSWISDNALYVTEMLISSIDLNFLTSYLILLNLNKFKKKSGQPLMTQTIIYSICIPLPPLPEQQKIVEILSAVDKKLDIEKKRKEKLEKVKKGLMQDLLTGKKRVKV